VAVDTIQNDLVVLGNFSAKGVTLPPSSVNDSQVAAAAGIQAQKLQHQYEALFVQYAGTPASTTTATNDQLVIHVVRGATATPIDFKAGLVTACTGAATVTVDLWRNGVTILTAVITLNNAQSAYQLVAAAGFSNTSWVVNDVIEVKVTAVAGGGTLGKGLFANLHMREDAQ
jgi:hypothetical protein